MADVDIAVPKASIRITPKTPGVLVGTGSVISVPLASIRITPKAPTYQKYPLVELQNVDGLKIYELVFPDINPGTKIEQTLILQNNTSNPINYSFTPTSTEEQVGSDIDTINSTYFSTDGTSWSKSITVEIPADDTITVYVRYQPPSTAFVGEKEWLIVNSHDAFTAPSLEGWLFVGKYSILGSSDGELTDYQVEVVLPYQPVMNTDFSDIRFRTADDVNIPYFEKEKVDEDYCIFTLKVPTILASPDITDVFIYAGNPEATSESNPDNVFLFFDDMTGTLGDKWQGGGYACGYGVFNGEQALILASTSSFRSKTFQATAPFKVELGMATDVRSGGNIYFEYCIGANKYLLGCVYGGGNNESIIKNSTPLVSGDLGGGSDWGTFILTLDASGNHIFKNKITNQQISINDASYNTGYIGVSHGGAGSGAVKDIMVSEYTPNQPTIGGLEGWNINQNLQVKGGILWQEPDLEGLDLEPGVKIKIGSEYYE